MLDSPDVEAAVDPQASIRLAEYVALRAESDRSAQLLSNAVWIGVTGFGLTLAGAGAASTNGLVPVTIPAVALLLIVQATAITTLYASELWKYIRVGAYIRICIEGHFGRPGVAPGPMYWETWINTHRARALHIAALAFLQAPVLVVSVLLLVVSLNWLPVGWTSVDYARCLCCDLPLVWALWGAVTLDVVLAVGLGRKLRQAQRGEFGGRGRSLDALAGVRGGRASPV